MHNDTRRRTLRVHYTASIAWRTSLLCILMLGGATTACSQNVQTQNQTMDQLPAAARLLQTQSAIVGEPEQRIVRDPAAWAALWASLHAGMRAPPLPPVDFEREVVAFATMGTRRSNSAVSRCNGCKRRTNYGKRRNGMPM